MEFILEILETVFIQMLSALVPIVLDAAQLAAVAFGVWAGSKLAYLLKDKLIRTIVERAATFVEQTMKDFGSEDKKAAALKFAIAKLAKWHIKVDEEDLIEILEAFVFNFKEHYKETVETIDTSVGTQ